MATRFGNECRSRCYTQEMKALKRHLTPHLEVEKAYCHPDYSRLKTDDWVQALAIVFSLVDKENILH